MKACVTDASGYVGSYIVQELLHRGFQVNAAVESDHESAVRHLNSLHDAQEKLTLYNYDLMDMDTLEDMLRGCSVLYHCAAPLDESSSVPLKSLKSSKTNENETQQKTELSEIDRKVVQPVERSTTDLLRACQQTTSIHRVVMVSCFTSSIYRKRQIDETFDFNPKSWSDERFLRDRDKWYHLSRLTAERTAWNFMEKGDRNFTLISVVPGLILGPMMTDNIHQKEHPTVVSTPLPYSVSWLLSFVRGEEEWIPNKRFPVTDVRDVARACILLTDKGQQQRYPCAAHVVHVEQLLRVVKFCFPYAKCPKEVLKEEEEIGFLNDKVETTKEFRRLGLEFVDLTTTVSDTLEKLRMMGKLDPDDTSFDIEYTV